MYSIFHSMIAILFIIQVINAANYNAHIDQLFKDEGEKLCQERCPNNNIYKIITNTPGASAKCLCNGNDISSTDPSFNTILYQRINDERNGKCCLKARCELESFLGSDQGCGTRAVHEDGQCHFKFKSGPRDQRGSSQYTSIPGYKSGPTGRNDYTNQWGVREQFQTHLVPMLNPMTWRIEEPKWYNNNWPSVISNFKKCRNYGALETGKQFHALQINQGVHGLVYQYLPQWGLSITTDW